MGSALFGGHDPQLADGGVAGTGDHVADAIGDVLGGEDLDFGVKITVRPLRNIEANAAKPIRLP
jgi:hypothetical protein